MTETDCQSTRYSREPCSGLADQRVSYYSSKGDVIDSHLACFTHALAECDRHYASGGMARVDFEPAAVAT